MFQTPTNMRTHRLRQHGNAPDLIPRYPLTERRKQLAAERKNKTTAKSSKKKELTTKAEVKLSTSRGRSFWMFI